MSLLRLVAAVAVGSLVACATTAEEVKIGNSAGPFPAVQQPQGLMYEAPPASHAISDVYPAQADQPYPTTSFAGHPYPNQAVSFVPNVPSASDYCDVCGYNQCHCREPARLAGCCSVCGCDTCQCCDIYYRAGWFFGFDFGAMHANMVGVADDEAAWFDDAGGAARITLGYEWHNGFGIRAQSWGFSADDIVQRTIITVGHQTFPPAINAPLLFSTNPDLLEIEAGTFYLDFYKAIVSSHGELLIGAGPASGMLEFHFPASGELAQFHGGGASVFAQGMYPFFQRPRWQLGLTGVARFALLSGEWEDRGGHSLNDRGDSMSIWELATGLELRRRCGRRADHYWFVRVMAELQQWTSDRMTPFGGDTLGLDGTSVHLGFGW